MFLLLNAIFRMVALQSPYYLLVIFLPKLSHKKILEWSTGNPARRCRLTFCSEIDQNLSKIKYGVNKAVKLETILNTFGHPPFQILIPTEPFICHPLQ